MVLTILGRRMTLSMLLTILLIVINEVMVA